MRRVRFIAILLLLAGGCGKQEDDLSNLGSLSFTKLEYDTISSYDGKPPAEISTIELSIPEAGYIQTAAINAPLSIAEIKPVSNGTLHVKAKNGGGQTLYSLTKPVTIEANKITPLGMLTLLPEELVKEDRFEGGFINQAVWVPTNNDIGQCTTNCFEYVINNQKLNFEASSSIGKVWPDPWLPSAVSYDKVGISSNITLQNRTLPIEIKATFLMKKAASEISGVKTLNIVIINFKSDQNIVYNLRLGADHFPVSPENLDNNYLNLLHDQKDVYNIAQDLKDLGPLFWDTPIEIHLRLVPDGLGAVHADAEALIQSGAGVVRKRYSSYTFNSQNFGNTFNSLDEVEVVFSNDIWMGGLTTINPGESKEQIVANIKALFPGKKLVSEFGPFYINSSNSAP